MSARSKAAVTLPMSAEPVPITFREDGVARVGHTRVSLDTLIAAYKRGSSAEEIALRYDSLHLADIYGAIAYYLRHQAEVDEYLERRRREADELRRSNDAVIDRVEIRNRLLARAASRRTP
jgi:uncharacterized protein (DUF433 family)